MGVKMGGEGLCPGERHKHNPEKLYQCRLSCKWARESRQGA